MSKTTTPKQIAAVAVKQQQEVIAKIRSFVVQRANQHIETPPGKTTYSEISRVSGILNVNVVLSRKQITMFTLYRIILSINELVKSDPKAANDIAKIWNEALTV